MGRGVVGGELLFVCFKGSLVPGSPKSILKGSRKYLSFLGLLNDFQVRDLGLVLGVQLLLKIQVESDR